ncbi:MAG: alpha-2-macroglobulin family protein [Chloroflexota bacterium]|jgi:CD109 antigen
MSGRIIGVVVALAALCFGIYSISRGNETLAPLPDNAQAQMAPTSTVASQEPIDGYLVVAPRVMRSGQKETVSVSLFHGDKPASGDIRLALFRDGSEMAAASTFVQERGNLELALPRLAQGEYQLQLTGSSFTAESSVRIEDGTLLFVESDKPIYKPGQTVHLRAITLDPQLKPVSGPVTLEVMDAKGLKVFKRDVNTDDYGMASLDLPLSAEPNFGVWKVTAKSGTRTAELDVRVERYVLPKYEVKVETAKEWVLAGEPITGTVGAEYSFGKSVKGEVEISATRYVGTWQEFATITKEIDGKTDFQLPAVGYVSGVPGAGGMGNLQLEVTVREKSTGYEEKSTKLLTVASTPVTLKIVPESVSFKPSLPMSYLVVAETPDKKPVDAEVRLDFTYTKKDFKTTRETRQISVNQGKAILQITPPADAISLTVGATSGNSSTSLAMQASYSPTSSFIHLEQVSQGALKVGDTAKFKVTTTKEAANIYYEVLARGKVVFSSFSRSTDIQFTLTPMMAPSARLLVYQLLPTSEVAADYLPFTVQGDYPHPVTVSFDRPEAKPGEQVGVRLQTEGQARVGLAAVDKSVFILAENRVNLQQVFDELEKLYQKPQAELHEARPMGAIATRGARETFTDAGVIVLSNKQVPEGQKYQREIPKFAAPAWGVEDGARVGAVPEAPMATPSFDAALKSEEAGGLMEVQRVRQFFPETWIWDTLTTDQAGKASKEYLVPDSITTWMMRAVALSKGAGLGITEAQLQVLQPFFVTVDLPYSVIRGEEFPVKVALYNYQNSTEEFVVELESADWFQLLDQPSKTVSVGPNDLGAASFTIKPGKLGTNELKVTARSRSSADAIVKELIVEPEGVAREQVENLVLSAGASRQLDLSVPQGIIEGSARAFLSLTGSYLTQTIEGLERLLQMPFGCGEQNMVLFAPNVYVTQYLKESGQLKPEIMAKAEHLMVTGYQRELTYRRDDGSFSAFGNQDKLGSLWLTAFVLKSFSQAKELIYVDDEVLNSAASWVAQHQQPDGSFEPVGFVHHQEMLGGLEGKTALTAYVAVALHEAGDQAAAAKAVKYLEGTIDSTNDAYGVALTTYALELAKSPRAGDAYNKLMALARENDEGLYWGDEIQPLPVEPIRPGGPEIAPIPPRQNQSATIETTGYALLALVEHGDKMAASRAARWLVSQRNAFGGFGSTQDTVVGLQALTRYASGSKADVDATITLKSGNWQKEIKVSPSNTDVLQVVDVPVGDALTVEVSGKGQVVMQTVRRFNMPDPQKKAESVFQLQVDYSVGQIEVNDQIDVQATIKFTPPEPIQAGMVVMDVAVPTGFAPVEETLDAAVKAQPLLKRYEIAGRKVIVYIEDMMPGDEIKFAFKAQALYPVKAQAVTSQVYAYYRPDWKGESLGGAVEVR